jgi:hypothetical protein
VFQMFQRYVTNVYMDVAKIDQDVSYVAMVVHLCCKRLFQMFRQFLQTYVGSVFIRIFYMFHTYVASVFICMLHIFFNGFQVFLQLFQTHVSSISSCL